MNTMAGLRGASSCNCRTAANRMCEGTLPNELRFDASAAGASDRQSRRHSAHSLFVGSDAPTMPVRDASCIVHTRRKWRFTNTIDGRRIRAT